MSTQPSLLPEYDPPLPLPLAFNTKPRKMRQSMYADSIFTSLPSDRRRELVLTVYITMFVSISTVQENGSNLCGCSGVVVEYRTRNREVAGSTHTWSTVSNLEQIANLLCAQANSASCPQRDRKYVTHRHPPHPGTTRWHRPRLCTASRGKNTQYNIRYKQLQTVL